MFGRKKQVVQESYDSYGSIPHGLSGFGDLVPIKFQNAHEAFSWGEFVLANHGATWRLYNKYGVPFTERMHSIYLDGSGNLKCSVGARREDYYLDDIYETNNGLINMIRELK